MNGDPEPSPTLCSHCGADTQQDRAAGLTYCSACGRDPRPEIPQAPLDGDDHSDQRRWRMAYWGWFFVTPIAALICAGLAPGFVAYSVWGLSGTTIVGLSAIGIFVVGMLGAAYCKVKLDPWPREWHEVITDTLGRVGVIFVIYLFLAPSLGVLLYVLANLVRALVFGMLVM